MNKIWLLVECLQKGKSLKNPETWKNAGALTAIFALLLQTLQAFFPDLAINNVDKTQIINGLTSICLVISSYVHIGSSEKVGF